MSDFILDYDILEAIAKNSNLLGKRSEEYAEQLDSKIINAIENVTGPSSGYLTGASDSVRDKINALKLKSETFCHFAEQILNLLEVAEQVDQEVADAIAAGREYFLEHHESLRIDDWKAKLLGLYVELKNSIPLLGTIADLLGSLDGLYESLKDAIKHWYECEGGKYIVDILKAYAGYEFAVGLLVLSVLALSLPVAAVFAVCGIIAAGIGVVNAATNIVTSYRAAFAAIDENPTWAMIYGKQNSLSDVLRQTNFGNGVFNDLSNLGAGAIDITETVCLIVGLAEAGAGVAKLFKGEAFKLLKNKGALNLSDLKSGVKNGILDLKSNIKQGYKDFKSSLKGAENVEDAAKDTSGVIKGGLNSRLYKDGFDNHLISGTMGKGQKGVIGGHNFDEFKKVLSDAGYDVDECIININKHPSIEGIYEVEYRIPARTYGPNGDLVIIPNQYKTIAYPKTVYDPEIISDEQMIQWGKEAMESGTVNGREIMGNATNGLKFKGYIDETTGEITNFYPVLEE